MRMIQISCFFCSLSIFTLKATGRMTPLNSRTEEEKKATTTSMLGKRKARTKTRTTGRTENSQ